MLALSSTTSDDYLNDVRAWIAACCRRVAERGQVTGRICPGAVSLIDMIAAGAGSPARLDRWHAHGPHAAIAREHRLTPVATDLLLLAAAPRLWGLFAVVYDMIGFGARIGLDEPLAAALLGGGDEVRAGVASELRRSGPLVTAGLVRVRPTGAVVTAEHVVRRLVRGG